MSVEDIASQSTRYAAWLKRHNFRVRVHVSPGSAETLVKRGGITNHHLIAYSLSNTSAKTYQNRLMCVEVIVCYISVVFLRHRVHYHDCCYHSVNVSYDCFHKKFWRRQNAPEHCIGRLRWRQIDRFPLRFQLREKSASKLLTRSFTAWNRSRALHLFSCMIHTNSNWVDRFSVYISGGNIRIRPNVCLCSWFPSGCS